LSPQASPPPRGGLFFLFLFFCFCFPPPPHRVQTPGPPTHREIKNAPPHPPTRFSREYVFRYRILMYSQSLLRIRISRVSRVYFGVFRVYSGVFSRYSRIRTEYRRAYLPKFYAFEIRQNTAYFRNFRIQQNTEQNTAEYSG
jgi:hypothetical protein